ncbi:MAG TPA: hypothetical protein VEK14_06145, partial [Rhodomicrobium sp.]|nr:hypothetical protein [Rhodomicrobium sp.]
NDSGMFETNLREDRFLPFEGAGAFGVFNLSLASQIRAFDYSTISDVILHIRHTARPAGNPLASQATKELAQMLDAVSQSSQALQPPLALMFCLRYDFPTEWSAFINGSSSFQVVLQKYYFPYMVQSAPKLTIDGLKLYAVNGSQIAGTAPLTASDLANITTGLQSASASATVTLPADPSVLTRTQEKMVYLILQYHFGKQ